LEANHMQRYKEIEFAIKLETKSENSEKLKTDKM